MLFPTYPQTSDGQEPQPILATPKRCKDAKELKGRLTACSLKVAEYEQQFKAVDEAQKIFVVSDMMPKDIRREFLTGTRKFDQGNDGRRRASANRLGQRRYARRQGVTEWFRCEQRRVIQRSVCHRLERVQSWQKEQAGKDRPGRGHGIVEKELMNGRAAREMTEARKNARKVPRAATRMVRRQGQGRHRGKGKGKSKSETRYCHDCGEQGHIGGNCPYKWANSIDEEDDQAPSWENEFEEEKSDELASLDTYDDEGEWCWPKKSRNTRRRERTDSRPAFHYLAEDDEQTPGGLNHLVSRDAEGTQWTWKKVTVAVDSGAAENVMPRSMFPEIGIRQTDRSKHGKGFKGPGGEHIKNHGQKVITVRTLEGFVCKSTWQAAEVRRPPVAASHIIQAGNDLFTGKDEAYIMNRRKKEKSLLRKEGCDSAHRVHAHVG